MTERTPWRRLSTDDKRELVRQAVQHDSLTYTQAAERLGTSRVAIAGVVERAKRSPNPIVSNSGLSYGGNRRGTAGGKAFAKKVKANKGRAAAKAKHAGFHKFVALPNLPLSVEPPARTDVWAALPGSSPVAIEDHTTGCRFPVGEDRPFTYCDLPIKNDSVYCLQHNAICYKELPAKRSVHDAR